MYLSTSFIATEPSLRNCCRSVDVRVRLRLVTGSAPGPPWKGETVTVHVYYGTPGRCVLGLATYAPAGCVVRADWPSEVEEVQIKSDYQHM